jgi:Uma2 family endonuclease
MENCKSDEEVHRFEDIDLSGTYSYADYLNWEINERLELIKGKIFKMSPGPTSIHQRISAIVHTEIGYFLKTRSCRAFAAPFDVRFPGLSGSDDEILTVLQPDICIICDLSKIDRKGCLGAPDIIIEILSTGNNQKELKYKYEIYESGGVREYWIIHPEEKTFLKYTLDTEGKFQPSRLLTIGDEVTTELLPGFTLPLDEVFRD